LNANIQRNEIHANAQGMNASQPKTTACGMLDSTTRQTDTPASPNGRVLHNRHAKLGQQGADSKGYLKLDRVPPQASQSAEKAHCEFANHVHPSTANFWRIDFSNCTKKKTSGTATHQKGLPHANPQKGQSTGWR
jgi:hypothetical protein